MVWIGGVLKLGKGDDNWVEGIETRDGNNPPDPLLMNRTFFWTAQVPTLVSIAVLFPLMGPEKSNRVPWTTVHDRTLS